MQEINRNLQTQLRDDSSNHTLLCPLHDKADTNDTSELMLFIQDMKDNVYFMIEGMKHTQTCVVLYERTSITADRCKLPRKS